MRFLYLLSLVAICLSHELCIDFKAPSDFENDFCTDYSGYSCCSSNKEEDIEMMWNELGLSASSPCGQMMQKLLCVECDPWGAHLFDSELSEPRFTSFLCPEYCVSLYEACADEVLNWPGEDPFGGSPISSVFPTAEAFCETQVPPNTFDSCYEGVPFEPAPPPPPPEGSPEICLELLKLEASTSTCCRITSVVSAFDDTPRIFATRQGGKIEVLDITDGSPIGTFLEIPVDSEPEEAGLLGLVFHPDFKENGRFFVRYSCKTSDCPPTCSSDAECNGRQCENSMCTEISHVSVLAEFGVSDDPNIANPTEIKRLLALPQPYGNHNGGDLLFGPDGFLYVMFGDGGWGNDPFELAQSMNTLLGKILRIDVDSPPDEGKEYHVPNDNPFVNGEGLPEIWAKGLRNPWKCSLDAENPTYFFCGDVGQDNVEEVDLIRRGGNYGWRKWEGTRLNIPDALPTDQIPPILEYSHGEVGGSPAVVGGYVYRGSKEPQFFGDYIYADAEVGLFVGMESPPGSGQFTSSRIQVRCLDDTDCQPGYIYTFGQDQNRDVYVAGNESLARIVEPWKCGIIPEPPTTSEEEPSDSQTSQFSRTVSGTSSTTEKTAPTAIGTNTRVDPVINSGHRSASSLPLLVITLVALYSAPLSLSIF